jgi:predicted phosphoribosyltransferase
LLPEVSNSGTAVVKRYRSRNSIKSWQKKLKSSSAASNALVVDQQLIAPLQGLCDQLITLNVVSNLQAVGKYFENFDQLADADVINLLEEAKLSIHSRV